MYTIVTVVLMYMLSIGFTAVCLNHINKAQKASEGMTVIGYKRNFALLLAPLSMVILIGSMLFVLLEVVWKKFTAYTDASVQ